MCKKLKINVGLFTWINSRQSKVSSFFVWIYFRESIAIRKN